MFIVLFFQKHFGLVLEPKLNFDIYLKEKISVVNNGIVSLRKVRYYIPRKPLLLMYKALLRSYPDFL